MSSVYDFIKDFEYEEMTYSELVDESPLRDHWLKYDEFNRLFGVTVNIYPENLSEKDHEPPEEVEIWIGASGCGGDKLSYIIPAKLGGIPKVHNVFPLRKDLDVDDWKKAEEKVCQHLKPPDDEHSDGDRSAALTFGFEYKDPIIRLRPSKLYYGFKMFSNGFVADEVQGEIENTNVVVERMMKEAERRKK